MKRITFKILSILLAAVLLVAALPVVAFAENVSPCASFDCEHNFVEGCFETYNYVSTEKHLTTLYFAKYCTICAWTLEFYEAERDVVPHTIDEESIVETYSHTYESNECHYTETSISKMCILCGEINETHGSYNLHEFDDSVDEEVDMQGICICCGEMIYW